MERFQTWRHHRRELRRKQRVSSEELQDLLALDPYAFEEAVGAILREMGFRNVRRTGRSGDLAVDITCRDKDGSSIAVQCKRYAPSNRIGSPEIQKFIGMVKLHHKADFGLFVTTSDFTRGALQLAAQHKELRLMNGLMLAEMLANIMGAAGKEVLDPEGALRAAGLTAMDLAQETRARFEAQGRLKPEADGPCQCETCSVCGGEMPWSKRLGAYWCQTCSQAEFPMAERMIRLMIPTL